MLVMRNIGNAKKEVEELINKASQMGVNVIELLWRKKRENIARVLGFKVPVFIKNRSTSAEAAISTDVEYVSKQVLFYPDSDNLCWGYVVDIPENRKVLVNSLSAGWYKIVDKATEKEISDMAVAKGKSIKPIEKEVMRVKGDKEKTLTDALNKKDQELEELKAKLEKLESDRKPIADALGIKK